jgi:hypothetical protein
MSEGAFKYISRLKKMDELLRAGNTGNAEAIAEKMGWSLSTVHNYIDILKSFGAAIEYNQHMKSYSYEPGDLKQLYN